MFSAMQGVCILLVYQTANASIWSSELVLTEQEVWSAVSVFVKAWHRISAKAVT